MPICENNSHTISLVIICTLLLAVVSIGCFYYYTRYSKKQEHLLPYKDTINKLKEIDINDIIKIANT